MKTKITKMMLMVAGMAIVAVSACEKKKNDPAPPSSTTGGSTTGQTNTQEVITDFELHLSTLSGTNVTTAIYKYIDPDGDGGQPATFGGVNQSDSVITLMANKTYSANIYLLDKTKNPIDSVSNEVEEEGDEHMFFFNQINPTFTLNQWISVIGTSGLTVRYNDSDGASTPRPIGLESILLTSAATGTNKFPLTIALRHQPNGVKNGTYAPGDTDAEAPFKFRVQ